MGSWQQPRQTDGPAPFRLPSTPHTAIYISGRDCLSMGLTDSAACPLRDREPPHPWALIKTHALFLVLPSPCMAVHQA